MRVRSKLILVCAAFALVAMPAAAVASGPDYNPGGGPNYNPGGGHQGGNHHQGPPPYGHAYGFFCKGQSKKHVKGQKGTAFSRCVKAMNRAANNPQMSPGQACKGLSKKHAKGEKGTPFSRCVTSVAKMRRQGFRYESPPTLFGPEGWGGWSCPAGTTVIGGGYEPSTATVAFSGPAKPGEPMYPVYPHHTFATGETGWVVQNDNDQETITVFVICR